nr:melatonin-related receptor-like [Pocillopora verrucosa]
MELLLSLSIWIFIPEVVLKGTPTFGDAICQFVGFITAMLATGSIYSMALIAINRYFLMVKSNLHRKYFTKRNAYISIAVSWILAGNFPVSYMLLGNKFKFHPGKGIYQRVKEHNALLRHHGGGNGSGSGISAKEIKVTKLLFAIVLSYTICWTPFYVIDLAGVFLGQYFAPRLVYVFYSIVVGSTTAISPIIYGVFNRELKGEIVKLLKSKCCCFCNKFKVGVPVTTSNRRS